MILSPTAPVSDLMGSPYQGYAYAYPHKTAYRPLPSPVPLQQLWQAEDRSALFLYVHVPFCEMRCAFCNLFTQAVPKGNLVEQYLQTLQRQMDQVHSALGDATFARFAIGGGTPTFLTAQEMESLFQMVQSAMGSITGIPVSIETSPGTIDAEKLSLLEQWGAGRISMGVQSFIESETTDVARKQNPQELETALELLSQSSIPTVNLDLIYGLPEQDAKSWRYSLHRALEHAPEELYLYPLYVRELTGLGRSHRQWDDDRLSLYCIGRDLLLESGYQQVSMRMFRKADAPEEGGPVYCCQTDGMVGLGCGARSYTHDLHYSCEYAVGAKGIKEILQAYVHQTGFSHADYGFALNAEEQRRRYVIQSLLQVDGLNPTAYALRFHSQILDDFPQLQELETTGLATIEQDRLRLTPEGLARSDAIAPWLSSSAVHQLMESYELR